MKLYDDLVWRGLIKDFSSPDLIDKLNGVARVILTGKSVIRAFNTEKREEKRL